MRWTRTEDSAACWRQFGGCIVMVGPACCDWACLLSTVSNASNLYGGQRIRVDQQRVLLASTPTVRRAFHCGQSFARQPSVNFTLYCFHLRTVASFFFSSSSSSLSSSLFFSFLLTALLIPCVVQFIFLSGFPHWQVLG